MSPTARRLATLDPTVRASILAELGKEKLAAQFRGKWRITEAGKKELEKEG
jgi:hypothetical protein